MESSETDFAIQKGGLKTHSRVMVSIFFVKVRLVLDTKLGVGTQLFHIELL